MDLGDPTFRLSVNLYGAPALTPQQFATYQQDLVIGVSLAATAPWGQYDSTRVVNIGTNRWELKPQIGASQALGHWTFELQAAVTFYTDNTAFYNGHTHAQSPLYEVQQHVIYGFGRGIWSSFDATYYTGGRSSLDGTLLNNLQQNWRLGLTLALPVSRYNSIKVYGSDGVAARTGNNLQADRHRPAASLGRGHLGDRRRHRSQEPQDLPPRRPGQSGKNAPLMQPCWGNPSGRDGCHRHFVAAANAVSFAGEHHRLRRGELYE